MTKNEWKNLKEKCLFSNGNQTSIKILWIIVIFFEIFSKLSDDAFAEHARVSANKRWIPSKRDVAGVNGAITYFTQSRRTIWDVWDVKRFVFLQLGNTNVAITSSQREAIGRASITANSFSPSHRPLTLYTCDSCLVWHSWNYLDNRTILPEILHCFSDNNIKYSQSSNIFNYINPCAAGGWFGRYKMMQKTVKNGRINPGIWVLIWEYAVRDIQWILTYRVI